MLGVTKEFIKIRDETVLIWRRNFTRRGRAYLTKNRRVIIFISFLDDHLRHLFMLLNTFVVYATSNTLHYLSGVIMMMILTVVWKHLTLSSFLWFYFMFNYVFR